MAKLEKTEEVTKTGATPPRPVRRRALAGVVVAAVAVSAITAIAARAEEGGGWGHQGRGGPGMSMWGGGGSMMGHVERSLDGLGLTDAQRAQVRKIVAAAGSDLEAQRSASRGLRERGMQVFMAPTVDASAAEALRQQMLTQQDQSSKRVLQAMLDVSQVLTPEQRAKLSARMKDRQGMMEDRMHSMQHDGPPRPPKP